MSDIRQHLLEPADINLEMLRHFLDFRMEVVTKRLEHELAQLLRRIHMLEGLAIIFNALDEALALIRSSDGKADAANKLIARFGLDDEQAEQRIDYLAARHTQVAPSPEQRS